MYITSLCNLCCRIKEHSYLSPLPFSDWVVKLGPVENGQYQYSLVTDPIRLYLFVLARDTTDFVNRFDKEVITWLLDNGFDTPLNRPIKTYQGKDCLYAPVPEY